ncbi:MAG: hypothetical protein CMM61_03135 [Rhodospirillaceae bacterium]|nr:hypothetical protein [Rhodospirillaceae bacterium]
MRAWYKYFIETNNAGQNACAQDVFAYQSAQMDGYAIDPAYSSAEAFFDRYFLGPDNFRYQVYEQAAKRYCNPNDRILSVGSGRCATELKLQASGYRIDCSDLKKPACIAATKKLFPELSFRELDSLSEYGRQNYDAILSFGVFFTFDDQRGRAFFDHMASFLKPGGRIVMDPGGAAENFLTRFLDDILLPTEAKIIAARKARREARPQKVVRRHHGFRQKDDDIIQLAGAAGFDLLARETSYSEPEFRRSRLFELLADAAPAAESMAHGLFGSLAHNIRLMVFKKTDCPGRHPE